MSDQARDAVREAIFAWGEAGGARAGDLFLVVERALDAFAAASARAGAAEMRERAAKWCEGVAEGEEALAALCNNRWDGADYKRHKWDAGTHRSAAAAVRVLPLPAAPEEGG